MIINVDTKIDFFVAFPLQFVTSEKKCSKDECEQLQAAR